MIREGPIESSEGVQASDSCLMPFAVRKEEQKLLWRAHKSILMIVTMMWC